MCVCVCVCARACVRASLRMCARARACVCMCVCVRVCVGGWVLQLLEDIGMWPKIRRLAGASAGAMTATLLAVGFDSYELEEFLSQDLSHIFLGEFLSLLYL